MEVVFYKPMFALLIIMIFLGVGVFCIVKFVRVRKSCTGIANATVIDILEEVHIDHEERISRIYRPVLEFYVNEVCIRDTYSSGNGNKCKHCVGQIVTVIYDIKTPSKYYIKGDKTLIILGIVFTLLGTILIYAWITEMFFR